MTKWLTSAQPIRNHHRTTRWNLFFNYVSIILAIVSGIVLVPLYLRYVPLDLYGAWLATGNILAWLTVIDPGLSAVIQQRAGMAYGKGDLAQLSALLSCGLLLSGTVALLVLAVGLLSSRFLAGWLNLRTALDVGLLEKAFVLAAAGSALMIFSYGLTAFNQGLQSSLGIGLVFIVTMVVSLALTVIMLYHGVGLLALPIGLIVRGIGLSAGNAGYLLWRSLSEKLHYRFSLHGISTLAKLSCFMFLGRSAGAIAGNLDAFVLTRYLGPEMAPVFVLTRKAPDMSRMFLERPSIAFMPAVAHLVGTGELERVKLVLMRLMRLSLWLLGLIVGGFIVFNHSFVTLWVGSDLFAGPAVNLVIVLALLISVLVNGLSNLCFSMGNIKGNSLASLAQGLLSAPLIIMGTKYWGMIGLALAPILAMFATTAWYYPWAFSRLLSFSRTDINMFLFETLMVVGAVAIVTAGFVCVAPTTWIVFILMVVTFTSLYALVLGILSQSFRTETYDILKRARWALLQLS